MSYMRHRTAKKEKGIGPWNTVDVYDVYRQIEKKI